MSKFYLSLLAMLLALSPPVTGQKAQTAGTSSRNKNTKQGITQKAPSLATPTSPQQAQGHSIPQQIPSANSVPAQSAPISPGGEPKESFSALTLFLFASALALFVALLGWSDQIRGINNDTKELEDRFLGETGIEKRDFLSVIKPKRQGEQLSALTKLMSSGRIQSPVNVDLISAFKAWNKEWSRLESISAWKYILTVALTIAFFLAGAVSLFTHPTDMVHLHFFSVRDEMLVLTVPMVLVAALLGIIICASIRENALRQLLESIAEKV